MNRRSFLKMFGAGAAAALVPTSLFLVKSHAPKVIVGGRKRRLARALSGLVDLNKFELYVHSGSNVYHVRGTKRIQEGDGFAVIEFPGYQITECRTFEAMEVLDDEGYSFGPKPIMQPFNPGDTMSCTYRLTT